MMTRIYKFYRNLSALTYLVILLTTYAYMPEKVGYLFNEYREPVNTFSRGIYFYSFLGLFFVVNTMLLLFEKQILSRLMSPNNVYLKGRLTDWIRIFTGTSNIFIVLVMIFLVFVNSHGSVPAEQAIFLVYLGLLMIIACLIWLVVIAIKQDRPDK
ncbi:hypothetical protein ACFLU5_10740 [Bacteroidota bacterium]